MLMPWCSDLVYWIKSERSSIEESESDSSSSELLTTRLMATGSTSGAEPGADHGTGRAGNAEEVISIA